MESYKFLLDIAIILLGTKALGLLTQRFYMPQVVGALVAGVILGPAVLGIVQETEFIAFTAEIGVILLMFTAGMETDIKELKSCGKSAVIIALLGVLVPLIGGMGLMYIFNGPDMIYSDAKATELLQNIFVGVILTATSVSITVETLKEMGKLNTKSGNAILAAAIIDDILGIIALTVISSFTSSNISIGIVLIKIVLFFVFAGAVGYVFYYGFKKWFEKTHRRLRRHTITAFVFCLLMSYAAEHFFGVADITGAYLAGVVVAATGTGNLLCKKYEIASYLYFSPIFFASIGLKIIDVEISSVMIVFIILITVVAILTKIIGCGVGAKLCGYTLNESMQIGTGMISRGEVALIVMSKGVALGLLGSAFVGPIVVAVVVTTIITPILLKFAYR